jgi:hypothetical protein
VRAGRGLQRDRVHAGDFDQLLAQRFDDLQRPWKIFSGW